MKKITDAQLKKINLMLNDFYPTTKYLHMGRWETIEKNADTNEHDLDGVKVRVRVFQALHGDEKKTMVFAILE